MDLVSTIRKQGSRGGVNFNWDDVATSAHRENYLGHSLKAPVGRWQQGKDLGWYAKGDDPNADPDETDEQRQARVRREEIQKIKEAEEDAMAKALGLPPPVRNQSGANAIEVTGSRVGGDTEAEAAPGRLQIKKEEKEEKHRSRRREGREGRDREHRHRHRHRSRSRSREGHTDRRVRDRAAEDESRSRRHDGRHRSRSPREEDRYRRHKRHEEPRSRSRDYRRRSRSRDRVRGQDRYRRSPDRRRSASPEDRRRNRNS